jgi:pyruvate kinase
MSITTELDLLRYRRTKIVATLGPASNSPEMIGHLIEAGVDIFRLNFSHGTHEDHRQAYDRVRAAADRCPRPIGVLADLCGPKIRVGEFENGSIVLTEGNEVVVTVRDVMGTDGIIPSQYALLAQDVSAGDTILLADGTMGLEVSSVDGSEITCMVKQGGTLSNRKGINLPGIHVSAPCLTEKDIEDAHFACGLGVDFLALSFVRSAEDVQALRSVIADAPSVAEPPWIIAKIEQPEALTHSSAIIHESDGIMVARGDLGVELAPERVPIAQDELIKQARAANKPVIVATQMLESMIDNARPTRAEVADVSQSVNNGTDAIMLSAETAAGRYPVQAVEMMDRVARYTEAHLWEQGAFGTLGRRDDLHQEVPFGDAVARATALLSRDLKVRAVVVISHGGMSAATMCAARPAAPIATVSESPRTVHRMALMWGSIPVLVSDDEIADEESIARRIARDRGLAGSGEYILLVKGFRATTALTAPSITLLTV